MLSQVDIIYEPLDLIKLDDQSISVLGLQYAGGHLRELQKAVKDPISNFGVVLGEVTKRGRLVVGLTGTNALASHVHPNLVETASVLCKNVELFGGAVEKVLIKHGEYSSCKGQGNINLEKQ